MGDTSVADRTRTIGALAVEGLALEHHGVKGMKWGVRKTGSGAIKARATMGFRDRRAEKWKMTAETKAYAKVYRRSAGRIRQGTRELNKDPRFVGHNFKQDSPTRRAYYDAYSKMVTNQLNATVSSRSMLLPTRKIGMSPNKRLELQFHYDMTKESAPRVTIRRADTRAGRKDQSAASKETRTGSKIAHANETDSEELEVHLITDDMGYIQDLDVPGGDEISHGEELAEDVLAHYGIKGMRWGIRKMSSTASGGSKAEPSADYQQATLALSKPSHALSNQEMQALITRMDLEKRYKAMLTAPKPVTRGDKVKKFVGDLLLDIGKTEVTRLAKGASSLAVEGRLSGQKFTKMDLSERISPQKKKKDK